jgi:hypothetical protein
MRGPAALARALRDGAGPKRERNACWRAAAGLHGSVATHRRDPRRNHREAAAPRPRAAGQRIPERKPGQRDHRRLLDCRAGAKVADLARWSCDVLFGARRAAEAPRPDPVEARPPPACRATAEAEPEREARSRAVAGRHGSVTTRRRDPRRDHRGAASPRSRAAGPRGDRSRERKARWAHRHYNSATPARAPRDGGGEDR